VRLLVARCTVVYTGRLGARLAPGTRLIVLKSDGSLAIHSDSGAYKPLNWMSPPCRIVETATEIVKDGTFGGFADLVTNAELNKFFAEDRKNRP